MFSFDVPSSTSTPFIKLGYFISLIQVISLLGLYWDDDSFCVHHSKGQTSVELDFLINSSVSSFSIIFGPSPIYSHNMSLNTSFRIRSCNDSLPLALSFKFYGAFILKYIPQHVWSTIYEYPTRESRLIPLNTYLIRVTFIFIYFYLEVSMNT